MKKMMLLVFFISTLFVVSSDKQIIDSNMTFEEAVKSTKAPKK